MRRSLHLAPLVAMLAAVLVVPGAVAQDAVSAYEGHPFVGAWLVDTNTNDPTEPPSRLVVHPDGTLLQADQTTVAIGVWEPTGDAGAALTITAQIDAGDGKISLAIVRAEVELEPGGDAWIAQATTEWIDEAVTASGQMGPIPAAATRIVVEPMVPSASPGF